MAKQLVLAVAGSGKTTKLLDSISLDQRTLIITYTTENLRSLEAGLRERFGCIPSNVTLQSYFSFLYVFCFRPIFSYGLRDNSYTWEQPGAFPAKTQQSHYLSSGRYLYSNRVAKYLIENDAVNKVIQRLQKYYDNFFIDEVQDFAANDFNFLMKVSKADVEMLFVGDFYQHTFDTSRDGNIRQNLHKKGYDQYLKEFENAGIEIDTESLKMTYRCSPTVCDFISKEIGIAIESHRTDETRITVIEDKEIATRLFNDDQVVKLFYQNSTKYPCNSNNWGKCKGLDKYKDVCVVLNPNTAKHLREGKLPKLADSTRNKLYVACSRTRQNLYFFEEKLISEFAITK